MDRQETTGNRLPPPSRGDSRDFGQRVELKPRAIEGRRVVDAASVAPVREGNADFARQPIGRIEWPFAWADAVVVGDGSGVNSQTPSSQPIYGDDDPFRIAADVFSRFYGGAPEERPDEPVIVGDTSMSSGSSGNGRLLVLLAVVGVVGYFLYKRYAS